LAASVNVPIVNLPSVVASDVARSDLKKVGLLATNGTLESRIFQSAFKNTDVELITPPSELQSELMEIIYNIKKVGNSNFHDIQKLVSEICQKSGAEKVILGCTELCIFDEFPNTVNVLNVLANSIIERIKFS